MNDTSTTTSTPEWIYRRDPVTGRLLEKRRPPLPAGPVVPHINHKFIDHTRSKRADLEESGAF